MPRFSEHVTDIGDKAIAMAVAEYGKLPEPMMKVPKKTLRAALKKAGGNIRKLTVEEDGGIIIWNNPQW
jgi:hypothetical protein